MTQIRPTTAQDRDAIRTLNLAAFPASENELVARLAVDLLDQPTRPATHSWVAEKDQTIVGHVAFSPVTLEPESPVRGYLLAPLSVRPDCQRTGIGSMLVRQGIEQLKAEGLELLLVYGDPAYYGRFGFDADAAEPFKPPYPLQYPFGWLAMTLNPFDVGNDSFTTGCVDALQNPDLW